MAQAALLNQQRCAFGLSLMPLSLVSLSLLGSSLLVNGFELLPIGGGVLVDAATITWGHVNKYSTVIHAEEVVLGEDHSNSSIDVAYPPPSQADDYEDDYNDNDSYYDYTITAISVYALSKFEQLLGEDGNNMALAKPTEGATTVEVVIGGIGQNNTVIRFERLGDEGSSTKAAYHGNVHFKLVIYGLDLLYT